MTEDLTLTCFIGKGKSHMKKEDVIRAWRDEEYFKSLSESERAAMPPNPAGISDLDDKDLLGVSGGGEEDIYTWVMIGCPNPWTISCTNCAPAICA